MRPADVAATNRSQRPGRALSAAINSLHEAVMHEPDPEDKAQINRALQLCLDVQKDMADVASPRGGK